MYPSIDPQPGFEDLLVGIAGEIETHYRGLGKDFYRIRPYEAFESARHVDWKASAHVGSLQVREFAREQEQTVEVFLDREIPRDLAAWFEHAIDCCAFLAWSLSSRGIAVHFRSQGYNSGSRRTGTSTRFSGIWRWVVPQALKGPEAPLNDTSYQIVFTVSPREFSEAGWAFVRVLPRGAARASRGARA